MLEHWLDVLHRLLCGLAADLAPRCRRIEDGLLRDEMRELLLPVLAREIAANWKMRDLIHARVDGGVKVHRRRHMSGTGHALLVCFVADGRSHVGRECEI